MVDIFAALQYNSINKLVNSTLCLFNTIHTGKDQGISHALQAVAPGETGVSDYLSYTHIHIKEKTMLIWEKIKNTCASIGYARASAQLSAQGKYDLARDLMLLGISEVAERDRAIKRLERVKNAKAVYEPGDHYMKGHNVAFWRGHAKNL